MNRLFIIFAVLILFLSVSFAHGDDITEYTRAIEQSPADMKYKFYHLRGLAHKDRGNVESAIRDFGTSIQIRPSYDAFLRRGELYFEKGAYNIAEHDFTKAIERNPSAEAYKLRGLTFLVSGKLDLAIIDGTEIINLAPNISESYNLRMEAYAQSGELKQAREDARRALSLDRRNSVASDLLVKYPEKIEITAGGSRFRPKGEIDKYRIWSSNQGVAFTKKTEEEEQEKNPLIAK